MMAFFMLMWLLNATTEKQRKGLADYFNPVIPINRISGGGNSAFGGDSVFSEDTLAKSGTGATAENAAAADAARGDTAPRPGQGAEGTSAEAQQQAVEKALTARGGESMTMERALRHVITRVTDEGLVIEVFDLPDVPLFVGNSAEPRPVTHDIAKLLSETLGLAANALAVNGHVRAYPITLIDNPVWDLSAARAQAFRGLIEGAGLPTARMQRIGGFADRKPVTADPMAVRNNRLEVILLRKDR
jgi:chemotaxis protein MotB